MNTIESYCLLIMGGLVAYVFTLLYCYLTRCWENWSRKQEARRWYRKKLFRQRCNSSYNFWKDYFYTLAVNNPSLLAADLAEMSVVKMTRKNLVNNYR